MDDSGIFLLCDSTPKPASSDWGEPNELQYPVWG
jgi:hypothetical protein